MEATYGLISLLPVAIVIISAIITKRAAESLIVGTLVGAILIAGGGFWGTWFDFLLVEIGDSAYYILMFGTFGAFIRLLDISGAAMGFADIGTKFTNSRKKTMVFAWILGIIIFVEDYLNALGVGVAMKSLTDKWKISREMLAYITNSTGAAVCILVPWSSWGVLYASQIDSVGILDMTGFQAYVSSIPFMFYGWIAVILTPLFACGILPLFGGMKAAEERVAKNGNVFPDEYYGEEGINELSNNKKINAINFILPMVILVVLAIITADITFSVIIAIALLIVMLLAQKQITIGKACDAIVDGFKDMLYVTALVLLAFVLSDFNDALGLTPYVIESVTPILSPALFPVIVFLVVAALAFCTGSFWGVAAICFPIILPLAVAMSVNPLIAIGAVAAGTSFGSHACFYSDAVTVTCAATGLKNIDYAKTSIPLVMAPFILATIAYLILGFVAL